jgi:flavin reductase (DIM6/NTAB) family NADH-FMN oxidoreductase RutF
MTTELDHRIAAANRTVAPLPPARTPIPTPEQHVSPDGFRAMFRQHAAGVTVVTLCDAGRPVGFTATSVISVSAEPPMLAFSIASSSSSWPALSRARTLTVSFLGEHQAELSSRFSGPAPQRFVGGGWSALPTGEPVIDDAAGWLRAQVVDRLPVGRSFLITMLAVEHRTRPGVAPLLYRDRRYHRLGEQR